MHTTVKYYWVKAILVSAIAFALGIVAYVLVGIAVAHGESRANAAWHQVTVRPITCDCIIKFVPEQPLAGSGTAADPYVAYNSHVPIVVGVAGAGLVTIEDQNGNVLYSYNKTSTGYEELIAPIELLDGLGLYELTVKLDGVEALGPNVISPMFIDYRMLPIEPPGPPDTGVLGHLYVGGYAVQTLGALMAGLLFGTIAFGVFMMVAARRRRRNAEYARENVAIGKVIKREFSAGAINKSGVISKKTRKGRGK